MDVAVTVTTTLPIIGSSEASYRYRCRRDVSSERLVVVQTTPLAGE